MFDALVVVAEDDAFTEYWWCFEGLWNFCRRILGPKELHELVDTHASHSWAMLTLPNTLIRLCSLHRYMDSLVSYALRKIIFENGLKRQHWNWNLLDVMYRLELFWAWLCQSHVSRQLASHLEAIYLGRLLQRGIKGANDSLLSSYGLPVSSPFSIIYSSSTLPHGCSSSWKPKNMIPTMLKLCSPCRQHRRQCRVCVYLSAGGSSQNVAVDFSL